jgi:hypothetical protein
LGLRRSKHDRISPKGRGTIQYSALQTAKAEPTVADPQLSKIQMGASRFLFQDGDFVCRLLGRKLLAAQQNRIHARTCSEE